MSYEPRVERQGRFGSGQISDGLYSEFSAEKTAAEADLAKRGIGCMGDECTRHEDPQSSIQRQRELSIYMYDANGGQHDRVDGQSGGYVTLEFE